MNVRFPLILQPSSTRFCRSLEGLRKTETKRYNPCLKEAGSLVGKQMSLCLQCNSCTGTSPHVPFARVNEKASPTTCYLSWHNSIKYRWHGVTFPMLSLRSSHLSLPLLPWKYSSLIPCHPSTYWSHSTIGSLTLRNSPSTFHLIF